MIIPSDSTIYRARTARGWSRRELGKRICATPNYVGILEVRQHRGELKSPSLDLARRLARAFGCTVEDLFPEDNNLSVADS